MRLKESFLVQKIDDTQYIVPVGAQDFRGLVRSNKTAACIVELLREDTTTEKIFDAMCRKYDAPREQIEADVKEVLDTLRQIDAIEE